MPWKRYKRLSYRDQTGKDQDAHVAHWEGFEWSAGDTIVKLKGPHGQIQVWASSEGEGRRVIRHACAIAGIDENDPACWWQVEQSTSSRNGKPGTFRTREKNGYVFVSKRDTPNGSPWWSASSTW